MAEERIPLNRYKRFTSTLDPVLKTVYKGLPKRANTIVTAIVSNISNSNHKVTLSLSSANVNDNYILLTDYLLQPLECSSILPFKLILTEESSIEALADIKDLVDSDDSDTFWHYTMPLTSTSVDMQLSMSSPTSAVINWGTQTSSVSTVTSTITTQFTYLPYTVPVNLTLSILETNNTQ